MNFPDISSLEGVFDWIQVALMNVSEFVRDLVIKFVPIEFQSLAYLGIAFGLGYWLREKIGLPTWVLLGTLIFVWIRFI